MISLQFHPEGGQISQEAVHLLYRPLEQPAEPRGGFLKAVAVASPGGSATLSAREGWGGGQDYTWGRQRKREREPRREFNNNPTSGYHFSLLEITGRTKAILFQWETREEEKWQP